MESNIIDKQIYEDLISQVDAKKLDLASKLMQNKAIEINKITYDNKQNFEVHSIVKDEKNDDGIIVKQKHKVYIKVAEGEIENLSCTCDDYNSISLAVRLVKQKRGEKICMTKYLQI